LYYLEFLSGQPVWGIVKKGREDNLNDNSLWDPQSNKIESDKYTKPKYYRAKNKPQVSILKNKKGKIFWDLSEYKTKNLQFIKNVSRQFSEQPKDFKIAKKSLFKKVSNDDPLNITFNKSGNQSAMKECPYKNRDSNLTNPTSEST